ncbi:MAG: hypothetical protein IBJ00_03880 [Alphaproteobacteria bacterium]|nr:hypothetical protein [Alphaproteobacteria bacterium]
MKNLHNSNRTNSPYSQQDDYQEYPSRKPILDDMEKIFILAMEMGKINVALRAKELIGKELGLFLPPSKRSKVNDQKASKTDQEVQVGFIQKEETEDEQKSQRSLITSNTVVKQAPSSRTGVIVRSSILATLLTGASLYSFSNSELKAQDLSLQNFKILAKGQQYFRKSSKDYFSEKLKLTITLDLEDNTL